MMLWPFHYWREVARLHEGSTVIVLERCERSGKERAFNHHRDMRVTYDPVWARANMELSHETKWRMPEWMRKAGQKP